MSLDDITRVYRSNLDTDNLEVVKEIKNDAISSVALVKDIQKGSMFITKVISKSSARSELEVLDLISQSKSDDTQYLVSLVDGGLMSPQPQLVCIIFPYRSSITLQEYIQVEIKRNSFPIISEQYCSCILLQIAKGLRLLHHNKYIHRDIKSENVLCFEDGTVKLIDYGFCVFAGGVPYIGEKKGTAGTTAPELWTQDPRCYFSSDIWSCGCVLYEMIFGGLLYENIDGFWDHVDNLTVYDAIVQETGRFITELNNDPLLSMKTVCIFEGTLEINPFSRIRTAKDLVNLLT